MSNVMGREVGEAAGRSRAGESAELARRLSGALVLPADWAFESARRVWNGMVDRRPAMIAYCRTEGDVVACVEHARSAGMPLSIRGGGHNIAGVSVCEGGLVVDLSRMNRVVVDPGARTARAGGGALLADLDATTQVHGLATTTGVNSDTGLVGLTLGGGIGRLGRKHGLACDNMLSARVVTSDGRILTASDRENADLFWALRGGGGNFGAVTEVVYRLHPLGHRVLAGSVSWEWGRAREALRRHAEFTASAPDEAYADLALVSSAGGERRVSVSLFYAGEVSEGERIFRPLREGLRPLEDQVRTLPYVDLQKAGDSIFPRGDRFYWKAQFLREIGGGIADAVIDLFPSAPSSRSLFVFQQVGGAIARVPAEATAYPNRDAAYDCFPVSIWTDPCADEANVAWGRAMYEAARPFATGGVYVNNLGDEGEGRVRAAYGANHARLTALKRKYDPDNVFRSNANVRPA